MGHAASIIEGRYRLGAVTAVTRDVVVYVADDVATARQVAVEVLRDEVAGDPDFVAAVREQAGKLVTPACAHRAIARVYECGVTEDGVLFVAVERAVGRTLREVLDARGALDPYNALRIAIQVGEALEVLHHQGIVHGELRPESVVLVTNQQVTEHAKLVGVELTAAHRTATGVRRRDAALLPYLAPEQIEYGQTTEASDVHALGRLLRDLLTAEPSRDSRAPRVPTPLVPIAIGSIIASALSVRADQRYADVTLMLNDMWGAQSDLDDPRARSRVVVKKPTLPVLRPRITRRELGIASAVGAAGIGFVALVWMLATAGVASTRSVPLPVPALTTTPAQPDTPLSVSAPLPSDPTPPSSGPLPSDATRPSADGLPVAAPPPPPITPEGRARISEPVPAAPVTVAPRPQPPTEARAPAPRPQPTEAHAPAPVLPSPEVRAPAPRPQPTEARAPAPAPQPPQARPPVPAPQPTETRAPAPAPPSPEVRAPAPRPQATEARAPAPAPQPTETRAPAPRPTPRDQPAGDDGDGAAVIDWLLKKKR
jgi:serine/threonine protein kinase